MKHHKSCSNTSSRLVISELPQKVVSELSIMVADLLKKKGSFASLMSIFYEH